MNTLNKTFQRDASFPVRHMNFGFNARSGALSDNPVMACYLATLSAMFPAGERYFVHSVRGLQHQAESAQLKKDIAAFIGQEAMHAKEHQLLNDVVVASGIDSTPISRHVSDLMALLKARLSPHLQLAVTAAVEHFTAIMARQIMRREDFHAHLGNAEMRKIWLWHAVEESEHKSVAFDLYREAGGQNWMRLLAMPPATIYMGLIMGGGTALLALRDRKAWRIKDLREAWSILLGRNGFISTLGLDYLDYYRLSFHPNDHESKALEDQMRAVLGLA